MKTPAQQQRPRRIKKDLPPCKRKQYKIPRKQNKIKIPSRIKPYAIAGLIPLSRSTKKLRMRK